MAMQLIIPISRFFSFDYFNCSNAFTTTAVTSVNEFDEGVAFFSCLMTRTCLHIQHRFQNKKGKLSMHNRNRNVVGESQFLAK